MDFLVNDLSLFGTRYAKPEDQVTVALLQLIARYGNPLVEWLFEGCDLPDFFPAVRTQITGVAGSRPDGEIVLNCQYRLLIESKIVQNTLGYPHEKAQLQKHLAEAHANGFTTLVYITPDSSCPQELIALSEVVWYSWNDIKLRLETYAISDPIYVFLVEEFKKLLNTSLKKKLRAPKYTPEENDIYNEDLLCDERVILVGGSWGEEVALNYNFYACQDNRHFAPAKYLAFYHNNRIKYLFEITNTPIECIDLRGVAQIQSTNYFTAKDPTYGGVRKLFWLKLVHTFDPEIINDSYSINGRRIPFVRRQRYTYYDKIMNAKSTSQL